MEEYGAELLQSLGDFTVKENWDKFFTLRGGEDAFEWYAEWTFLKYPLLSQLSSAGGGSDAPPVEILVPGCGSSRMSEHLYDAGYHNITNIDFSKVIISDMLRRNVRVRPEMKWRIMDMTEMQFADEVFDAVIDKGGLDALMEPKLGATLGGKFLKEVKRVLKHGGKYICLTLVEFNVLSLLLSEFRYGWKTTFHIIPSKLKSQSKFQTYMVVTEKEKSNEAIAVQSSFDLNPMHNSTEQYRTLVDAIENENNKRSAVSSAENWMAEAKAAFKELNPGSRFRLTLGKEDISAFSYNAVLLDACQGTDAFNYHCGIFLVPKNRAHEWLFSSEEGQWMVVESSKAARLVMVFLDSSHSTIGIDAVKKDLSPLVRELVPGNISDEAPIPFMMASDGIKERTVVKKVTSTITGPIIVEDIIMENVNNDLKYQDSTFRRLVFERSLGLVQSEALLIQESVNFEKNTNSSSSRHKKKANHKRGDRQKSIKGLRSILRVDHGFLASSYHNGIISGFILVASALKDAVTRGKLVKTAIIGLGAGLLPMYLHKCLPFLGIEVVELDPVVVDLAKSYFDFKEDDRLKVHIADGVKFIQSVNTKDPNFLEECPMRILIIDADASDVSSGLTCPPIDFLEEPFLSSVKEFIGEGGLFIVNLVSRSKAIRQMIISRMKLIFRQLNSLELEEDVNEVLFAMPVASCITSGDDFSAAASKFEELLKFDQQDRGKPILESATKIRFLK